MTEVKATLTNQQGRRVTLDPIHEKVLPVAWREVESTIPCGFRFEWITGTRNGAEFDLSVGAGCGSPWMTFTYKGREYCINAKDMLEALFVFDDEIGADS